MSKREYTAIKVRGADYWLWFSTKNTEETSGIFTGKGGWGPDGTFTEIEVNIDQIEGRMTSDTPFYSTN